MPTAFREDRPKNGSRWMCAFAQDSLANLSNKVFSEMGSHRVLWNKTTSDALALLEEK
jgi:hypothetical protein